MNTENFRKIVSEAESTIEAFEKEFINSTGFLKCPSPNLPLINLLIMVNELGITISKEKMLIQEIKNILTNELDCTMLASIKDLMNQYE